MKLRYHVLSKKADSHHDACLSFSFLSPACMFVPPLRRGKCGEGESRESAASQLGQEDPQQPSARSVIPLSLLFACLLFRMQFQKQSLLVQKGSAVTCQLVERVPHQAGAELSGGLRWQPAPVQCVANARGGGEVNVLWWETFLYVVICATPMTIIFCVLLPQFTTVVKTESSK